MRCSDLQNRRRPVTIADVRGRKAADAPVRPFEAHGGPRFLRAAAAVASEAPAAPAVPASPVEAVAPAASAPVAVSKTPPASPEKAAAPPVAASEPPPRRPAQHKRAAPAAPAASPVEATAVRRGDGGDDARRIQAAGRARGGGTPTVRPRTASKAGRPGRRQGAADVRFARDGGGPRGACGTQGGGSGTRRVDDAGGALLPRPQRSYEAHAAPAAPRLPQGGARDAAGRTLRAADGIGRTRGGLTSFFFGRARKSFPPLDNLDDSS